MYTHRVGEVLNESCNRSVEMSVHISGPSRKSSYQQTKLRSKAAIPTAKLEALQQFETVADAIPISSSCKMSPAMESLQDQDVGSLA